MNIKDNIDLIAIIVFWMLLYSDFIGGPRPFNTKEFYSWELKEEDDSNLK
jgi:hypothetical protein